MIGDSSLGFQALHYDRSQRKPRFLLQWRTSISALERRMPYCITYFDRHGGNMISPIQVKFSLSSGERRSSGGGEDGCRICGAVQFSGFANETIYWKIDRGKHQALHRQNDFIVSFNIRDEKFQTITHPADWRPETHRQWRSPVRISTQLVELRGHLYLVETAAFSYVAVWKLSDPGNSTWSKACTIDISKFHPSFVGEIQCVKGTEIIFNSCTRLLLYYDEKNKTSRRKMLPCSAANLTIYCESLTFPATQQV
uniref:F-box associated beta-propeller type 3 domain-containing protein n=1 Tax=Salix viminalis TaxID=40686 RepID=A0A6N2MKZ4_SALVM